MFNSGILDVALGVTFVFILVSTMCSAIREGLESLLKTRAAYLEYAIREVLRDPVGDGLAKSFFNHPLIHGLYQGDYRPKSTGVSRSLWHRGGNLPSYIPPRSFALALIDLAARGPSTDAASADPDLTAISFDELRANVRNLQNVSVQRALLSAIDSAQGDLNRVRENLEAWYDGVMERVSGWYKRSTQWVLFVIAASLVGLLNVNALTIADALYRDSVLRGTVVAAAGHHAGALSYGEASQQLDGLGLPIGWGRGWSTRPASVGSSAQAGAFSAWHDVIAPIVGLLITAFAATLGAPLWFDVLNRITMLRASVKPSDKGVDAAADSRQLARARDSSARSGWASVSFAASAPAEATPALVLSPPMAAVEVAEISVEPAADERDGCDGPILDAVPDDELPVARGGVA